MNSRSGGGEIGGKEWMIGKVVDGEKGLHELLKGWYMP